MLCCWHMLDYLLISLDTSLQREQESDIILLLISKESDRIEDAAQFVVSL
uniref:Uncharacterized protein n=1 Tax=Rhizophora mucronata TaxID=61149 RepID=A0A2P2PXT8_RHIMU